MRRFVVALSASLLALGMLLGSGPARAAVPGYDSSYFGESAFLNLAFGQSGQFVAIFTNSGATGWAKNTVSQVNLGVCLADKVTCAVSSPNAAWNDGTWLSNAAYATASSDFVGPGQNAFFAYNVRAPTTAPSGTYRFNGELVLASTLQVLRPQGYYQDASVSSNTADTTPPNAVVFTSGYPSQNGFAVATKGQAYDIGGGVASVSVKVQKKDAGVWTDVTSFSAATPDDGSFGSVTELFTHTTAALTIGNGLPVQVIVRVTDTGGNMSDFTSAIIQNGGTWSTVPTSSDTTPPALVATSCIDPLTGAASNGCGVNTSATTPSSSATVVFSAFASDDVGVTMAEYALTKPTTGDTVIPWTPCAAADGAFGSKLETVACTITFPTAAVPQSGGTSYVVLIRAGDAGGNKSAPADVASGAFGAGETCTFFQSPYASGSGGAATTGNCIWTYDSVRPYIAQTERSFGTIAPDMPVDSSSLIVVAFSESMRAVSTTNPQSITVTDGHRTATLTHGVNANFNRCVAGITVTTPGFCAGTNDGTPGAGKTWQIQPSVSTGLFYPLTILGINNFRDYAGNSVDLNLGDRYID